MAASVFICYGHEDQSQIDWIGRLELYLAQARRSGNVDVWHDGRIRTGADFRAEIDAALREARAAVLLVGPGFLGSSFIQSHELPSLLESARSRGLRMFPLVTGWCAYEGSVLGPLQAFNDWKQPLESLAAPEQNRILNELSVEVSRAVEHVQASAASGPAPQTPALSQAMRALWREMELTGVAFRSQNARCRDLVDAVTRRLGVTEHLQYEKFLFTYHAQMTPGELFDFQQVRVVTEGPLADGNRRMLDILLDRPALMEEVPSLTALRQHLVFWMNKFERVFQATPAMAVCYVGVEDGVPWPSEAEAAVREWLARHPPEPGRP